MGLTTNVFDCAALGMAYAILIEFLTADECGLTQILMFAGK
jgi:hypothetical protein